MKGTASAVCEVAIAVTALRAPSSSPDEACCSGLEGKQVHRRHGQDPRVRCAPGPCRRFRDACREGHEDDSLSSTRGRPAPTPDPIPSLPPPPSPRQHHRHHHHHHHHHDDNHGSS
eukprot:2707360-Rhodomonas_salina.2